MVILPGAVLGTLTDEGWWTARDREGTEPAVAAYLDRRYGPTCALGAEAAADPLRARAEAAAAEWRGEIIGDERI